MVLVRLLVGSDPVRILETRGYRTASPSRCGDALTESALGSRYVVVQKPNYLARVLPYSN